MSIISPFPQNTEIKLYKGIPWGSDYKEIRLFNSEAERATFLEGRRVATWQNCSIIKQGETIRLTGQINDYLTCNYLSFVNNGAGQLANARTFYAFILGVNYVNINTFEVEYQIDWIQSYLFDFEIGECMVEREHVNNDSVGENTLEEGIDIGEYCVRGQDEISFTPVVLAYYLAQENDVQNVNNVASCLHLGTYALTDSGLEQLKNLIALYNETPERLVMLQMGVTDMVGGDHFFHKTETVIRDSAFSFGGKSYTPVNKKLLCYPYMLLSLDNFNGQVEQYRWEMFDNPSSATFAIEGSASPKPCMECFPVNYKGATASPSSPNTVEQEGVFYENFPQVPYATDAFRAWVSQYGTTTAISVGASVATSVIGMATGAGMVHGLTNLIQTGASAYQQYKDHKIHSQQMHGDIGASGLQYARDSVGFRVTQFAIRPEYAQRIDNFFTRYGYRVDASKKPNIRGRAYLNYVKCSMAQVDGDIPIDTKQALENALTSGTTFWHVNQMNMIVTYNPIVG